MKLNSTSVLVIGVCIVTVILSIVSVVSNHWWVIGISVGIVGLMAYFIVNLLSQVEYFENYIENSFQRELKKSEDFDKYYQYLLGLFVKASSELQRIDKNGSFSSDDEVGFSFKVLQRAIDEVKQKIENLKVNDEEKR